MESATRYETNIAVKVNHSRSERNSAALVLFDLKNIYIFDEFLLLPKPTL